MKPGTLYITVKDQPEWTYTISDWRRLENSKDLTIWLKTDTGHIAMITDVESLYFIPEE